MRKESCAVFPVESGGPMIMMGVFFAGVAIVSQVIGGNGTLPLPISLLFAGFGIFCIWLGIRK
jgi:hypothetical protein